MYFMDPAAILYGFLDVCVSTHDLSLVPLSFSHYIRMELQAVMVKIYLKEMGHLLKNSVHISIPQHGLYLRRRNMYLTGNAALKKT